METVEVSAKAGSLSEAAQLGVVFFLGFSGGLIGLAWFEEWRDKRRQTVTSPLEVATVIAVGIGLHNFAEGLAIGQSFAGGAVGLGTLLVIGFALHNATEGFGIAGPLVGLDVNWTRLLTLGLIAGGPTVLGAALGGVWVNRYVELFFLSMATGSLIYVTRELFRIRFKTLGAVGAMAAVTVGVFIGFGTELIAQLGQSRSTVQASITTTIRFAAKQSSRGTSSVTRGDSIKIENNESTPLVFEGNGLFVGEVVVPAGGGVSVRVTGKEGQYRLIDERGQSGSALITVTSRGTLEPLTDEVNAVGALTVLEGHVRASKELHDRGVSRQGPNPALDLTRAGKHAGHPQHELLAGHEPDALALQQLLNTRGVFDQLNDSLSAYVKISGDGSAPKDEVERKYAAALAATEQARRAIAGTNYETPAFRAQVVRFVLDTAAGEYATATEGGGITVVEPGVPGKDNFIEYQDARGFLQAARDLMSPLSANITGDSRAALDELQMRIFPELDPADPKNPIPAIEMQKLIEHVKAGLPN